MTLKVSTATGARLPWRQLGFLVFCVSISLYVRCGGHWLSVVACHNVGCGSSVVEWHWCELTSLTRYRQCVVCSNFHSEWN